MIFIHRDQIRFFSYSWEVVDKISTDKERRAVPLRQLSFLVSRCQGWGMPIILLPIPQSLSEDSNIVLLYDNKYFLSNIFAKNY